MTVMKVGVAFVDASDNVIQTVGLSPAITPTSLIQSLTLAPRNLPAARRLNNITSVFGISPALAAISVTIRRRTRRYARMKKSN